MALVNISSQIAEMRKMNFRCFPLGLPVIQQMRNKPQAQHPKIRNTVIHFIDEVFGQQPDNVVLYICLNSDGRGRNSHANFERWFDHAESTLERYDAPEAPEKNGYYSSSVERNSP